MLLAGGWGSGKSLGGLLKMMQLKGINGRRNGLIVAQTLGALEGNILEPLRDICEQSLPRRFRPRERSSRSRRWLQYPDGCRVYLGTAENPKSYDGLTVAWAWGDECRYWSRYAWQVFSSRVRGGGAPQSQIVLTSTPAMNWMDEEFNTGKANRRLIRAPTRENAHNLRPGYIEDIRESVSPRMARAMLDGEFTPLEGAVFEDFDPNPETSDWFVNFNPGRSYFDNRKVMIALDPGFRRSAWLFIVEHDTNLGERGTNWIVFDQMMPERRTIPECVMMANEIEHPNLKGRKLSYDEVWSDPAGDATEPTSGLDVFHALTLLRKRDPSSSLVRVIDKFRSVSFGIDKTRVLLGGYANMPKRIKFATSLAEKEKTMTRGIIKDLGRISYPEKEGKPISDEPLKDGISDHSVDSIRYWSVGRWLTNPWLRSKDPYLTKELAPGELGYRVAA